MKPLPQKLQYSAGLLALLVSLAQIADADTRSIPDSMAVITANNTPFQHIESVRERLIRSGRHFAYYNLDAIQTLEHNLSQGLPNNEILAKTAFQQHLQKIGVTRFKSELLNAYQGLILSSRFQIHRYPAIIFDDNAVVYGVTDLQLALEFYKHWRLRQAANPDQPTETDNHE